MMHQRAVTQNGDISIAALAKSLLFSIGCITCLVLGILYHSKALMIFTSAVLVARVLKTVMHVHVLMPRLEAWMLAWLFMAGILIVLFVTPIKTTARLPQTMSPYPPVKKSFDEGEKTAGAVTREKNPKY